eukprot:RCo025408
MDAWKSRVREQTRGRTLLHNLYTTQGAEKKVNGALNEEKEHWQQRQQDSTMPLAQREVKSPEKSSSIPANTNQHIQQRQPHTEVLRGGEELVQRGVRRAWLPFSGGGWWLQQPPQQ